MDSYFSTLHFLVDQKKNQPRMPGGSNYLISKGNTQNMREWPYLSLFNTFVSPTLRKSLIFLIYGQGAEILQFYLFDLMN